MIKEKHLKDEIRRYQDDEAVSPTYYLISSIRIDTRAATHDLMSVYNRGALAGTLVVNKGDALEIARRLLPDG